MPRYTYYCSECEKTSVIFHLSDETASECPNCKAPEALTKQLTSFTTGSPKKSKQKVGQATEEYIKDARESLKRQKQKLNNNR